MKLPFAAAILVVSALCVDAQYFGGPPRQILQGYPGYGVPGYGGPEAPRFGGVNDQGYPAPLPLRPPEYPFPPQDDEFGDSSPPRYPPPRFLYRDFDDSGYRQSNTIEEPLFFNKLFSWIRNLMKQISSGLRNMRFSRPRIGGRIIMAGPGFISYLPYGPAGGYQIDPGFSPPFYGYGPFNDMPFPGQPGWPASGVLPTPPERYPGSEPPPPETSPAPESGEPPETSPVPVPTPTPGEPFLTPGSEPPETSPVPTPAPGEPPETSPAPTPAPGEPSSTPGL